MRTLAAGACSLYRGRPSACPVAPGPAGVLTAGDGAGGSGPRRDADLTAASSCGGGGGGGGGGGVGGGASKRVRLAKAGAAQKARGETAWAAEEVSGREQRPARRGAGEPTLPGTR